jgi:hypothetical protein
MDEWSDLDLTFGLKSGVDTKSVLDEWTALLASEFGVVTHFDLRRGAAIYRVILFQSGLELDLSVVPETEYGALGPNFKLLFGTAIERTSFPEPSTDELIGWCWHHVLHANSAINRERYWQAVFWLNELRNHIFTLKCIRLKLPSVHARGIHQLQGKEVAGFENTLVRSLDAEELRRVLTILRKEFIEEVKEHDPILASELENVLIG